MNISMMCYTGTLEELTIANAQIDSNCGFPNACTETWAIPNEAYEQDFYYIPMPPTEGYMTACGSWTQDQMTVGVTNVDEQEFNPNWIPPYPPQS